MDSGRRTGIRREVLRLAVEASCARRVACPFYLVPPFSGRKLPAIASALPVSRPEGERPSDTWRRKRVCALPICREASDGRRQEPWLPPLRTGQQRAEYLA